MGKPCEKNIKNDMLNRKKVKNNCCIDVEL